MADFKKEYGPFLGLAVAFVAMGVSIQVFGLDAPPERALLDSLFSFLALAVVAYGMRYYVRGVQYDAKRQTSFLIMNFFASAIASALWVGLMQLPLRSEILFGEAAQFGFEKTVYRFVIGILLFYITIPFYHLRYFYTKYLEKAERESEMRRLVSESELKTLKFQINPHFIFNSLNSVAALTAIDPKRAGEMTTKLAEFLRATLSTNLRKTAPLADEIRTVRNYLAIEKVRFDERLQFEERVDEECLDVETPNMILQPLLENAVKYGVYESMEPVTVRLTASRSDGYLTLLVENDYDPEITKPKRGAGVGQTNIRRRLQLIYGADASFETRGENGVYRATLRVPVVIPEYK